MLHIRRTTLLAGTLMAALVMGANAVRAESTDVLSDEQRTLIVNTCTDLQATLNQIDHSDRLARHDQGQLYLSIADKLMTPLNQRLAANRLDGSQLLQIAANYSLAYQDFYNTYRDYGLSLRNALEIDCKKQPVMFYDAIAAAREKRNNVQTTSQKLLTLAEQYRTQVTQLRTSLNMGTAQ